MDAQAIFDSSYASEYINTFWSNKPFICAMNSYVDKGYYPTVFVFCYSLDG